MHYFCKRLHVYIVFDIVDIALEEHWLSANLFRNLSRQKKVVCMKSTDTAFLLTGAVVIELPLFCDTL